MRADPRLCLAMAGDARQVFAVRVDRPWRFSARTGGMVCALLLAGCAGIVRAPEHEAPPAEPPQAVPAARASVAAKPEVPPAAAAVQGPAGQVAAKPAAAPPSVSAKASPLPPPLDLKSLETRLKETKAIGVFTKLALKNQVDDLLDRFRAFYQGRLKTSLVELRRSYDLLVLKVLALLQDADPLLANAIAASRESIWGILSNPVKFAAI